MPLNVDSDDGWKNVGYWFSEKKSQKFGSAEMTEACRKRKIKFIKVDLQQQLELQGPFHLIIHKWTAIYALALVGDAEAQMSVQVIENYLKNHPEIILLDPLERVKMLLLRDDTYKLLQKITKDEEHIFTPSFVALLKKDAANNKLLLKEKGVTFPVVCKPLDAGGGVHAHQMALVLSEDKMDDFPVPCVAESFIKHGAVLYKLLILQEKWFVTLRPSLKNFDAGNLPTIFFNSHQISKLDSCSPLTYLDTEGSNVKTPKADLNIMQRIVTIVRDALLCDFLGIDVVIDVERNRYAIIDVNPFPSYDMVPNLMDNIADILRLRLDSGMNRELPYEFCPSSGVDQQYFVQNLHQFSSVSRRVQDQLCSEIPEQHCG